MPTAKNKSACLDACTSKAYTFIMFVFIELHPFAAIRDKYLSEDG
jgi:hypothetical protein